MLTADKVLTFAVSAPVTLSFWPSGPVKNMTCLQGDSLLDPAEYSELADKDVVIFQSFYPTVARLQSRINAINAIRALQVGRPQTKFFLYMSAETWKVTPAPGNNAKDITRELIDDPVKGNVRWQVHRVGDPTNSGLVESEFDPPTFRQVNCAVLVAGLNSLAENYAQAFWKEWDNRLHIGALDLRPLLAGVFFDVFCHIPPPMTQNNGALNITDPDFDTNGVVDVMTLFGAASNAGARKWCEGMLEIKAQFESRFPGKHMIPNMATYNGDFKAGLGPLPMSLDPYYRKFELPLDEVCNFEAALRIAPDGVSYNFTGNGSMTSFFRMYEIQEHALKLDANIPATLGKGAVPMHINGIDRAPTSTDIDFMRFWSLISLLVERAAACTQLSGRRAFQLDELLLEFGNPLAARSMGTFSETTTLFTMRSPDRTVVVGATTAQLDRKSVV